MSSEPEVTLVLQGGKEVPCRVERYPDLDRSAGDPRGQVTYYRAVPASKVRLGTYEVRHTTPAHTAFFVDVPRAGLMDSMQPEDGDLR